MMRRLLSVAGLLTFALSVPATAQTAASPEMRQQVEAFLARHFEAVNRRDAHAIAADYVPESLAITSGWGMVTGPAAIEEHFRRGFSELPRARETITVEQVQAIGKDAALAAGPFNLTIAGSQVRGTFAFVIERRGNAWKVRLASFSRLAMPPPMIAPPMVRQ
jgi:uncharacterized protein (TIGR02246 family)